MMPQTRPAVSFRSDRMNENDMNQKLQMMQMHRSAQEPFRQAQQQATQAYTPQQQEQIQHQQQPPQPLQQKYMPQYTSPMTSEPAAPRVRVKSSTDTIQIRRDETAFYLPSRCVTAQITQVWAPSMEYHIQLPTQKAHRTLFLQEHDGDSNTKYRIELTLPLIPFRSIQEMLTALNDVANQNKEIRYRVHFSLNEEHKISITLSDLHHISNDPDEFDRAHGNYRHTSAISIVWQADSVLAEVLGFKRNSNVFRINDKVDSTTLMEYLSDVEPLSITDVPFFYLSVNDYATCDWLIEVPHPDSKYKVNHLDGDEGGMSLVGDMTEALMERSEPIVCNFALKHPTLDCVRITIPENQVLFLRVCCKVRI